MLRFFTLIPLLLIFIACGQNDLANIQESSLSPAPPLEEIQEETSATAPASNPLASLSVCRLLAAEKISSLLGCQSELTTVPQESSRENRCTYRCTDPFAMLVVNVSYLEKGTQNMIKIKRSGDFNEEVKVAGADAAFFQDGQKKLQFYKGKYAVTIFGQSLPNPKSETVELASLLVDKL